MRSRAELGYVMLSLAKSGREELSWAKLCSVWLSVAKLGCVELSSAR